MSAAKRLAEEFMRVNGGLARVDDDDGEHAVVIALHEFDSYYAEVHVRDWQFWDMVDALAEFSTGYGCISVAHRGRVRSRLYEVAPPCERPDAVAGVSP